MAESDNYEKYLELVEASEKRIDKTNAIVNRLADCIEHLTKCSIDNNATLNRITDEYSKHLTSLSMCRDEMMHQNSVLLDLVSRGFNTNTTSVNVK